MFLKHFFADLIKINIERIFVTCHCPNCCDDSASEKQGEIKIMFRLSTSQAPVNFGAQFVGIKDARGNVVERSEIKVNVRTADETILGATYDETTDTGVVTPTGLAGESSFTLEAVDKDEPTQILAVYSNVFLFVADDPESIDSINVTFQDIAETP